MPALTASPDALLSRRLRERDHTAWEELYAEHGASLRAFALRLTRNPHEADDLVQETFIRALPRLDRMDPDQVALRPYLFTTLRNTFLKNCDRAKRVAPVDEVPEPKTPGAIEDDPERSLLLQGQIADVRAANATLAPRQRLALALRELEGCSYAEIGTIIGLNENAVAQLISRARERLRSALRLAQIDATDLSDSCRALLPQLSRHLDGGLRGPQLERVLGHLAGCADCSDALESMREAGRRYRGFVPPLLLAADAHAAAIDAQLTAAGYWQSCPSRRPAARSRHIAMIAAGALLLGGGGALVFASGTERAEHAERAEHVAAAPVTARAPAAPVATAPGPVATPLRPAAPKPAAAKREVARAHAARAGAGETPQRAVSRVASPRAPAARRAPRTPARRAPARRRDPAQRPPARAAGADARPPAARSHDETPPPERRPAADTTPPSTDITAVSTTADGATFIFTASENGATPACALDASTYEPCTSPRTYAGLAPGAHTFSVRATDAAGNTGAPDTHAWQVHKPLPDLVITALTATGFTVRNAGHAAAGAFAVAVNLVGSYTFAGLPAGAQATRSWPCRSGLLRAFADRSNTVAESDETNNGRTHEDLC